jgi:hypothetical protein
MARLGNEDRQVSMAQGSLHAIAHQPLNPAIVITSPHDYQVSLISDGSSDKLLSWLTCPVYHFMIVEHALIELLLD